MSKNTIKTTSRAVIYARFSSDKQREESIDGQIRECTAYAKSQNLEVIGTYIDRALSARSDNRPAFLRMIADSSRRMFQYVIVYQLDRFSRSRYDSAIYKNRLKKNGVRVLSAKERIGDDPASIILESMLEGYAEYYSAELSQKVMRGMTENVLEKKWAGSQVPLGYRLLPDKRLEIVPEEAEAVRIIYNMYLSGKRHTEIADYLNAHGYITHRGRQFKRNSFRRLLSNKIYTGEYTWHGNTVADFAPRIIDDKTWAVAQKKLQEHSTTVRKKKQSAAYALTGVTYCGICGQPMTGQSGRSHTGTVYRYYRCSTKNNYHDRGRCTGSRNINQEKLEDIVLRATVDVLHSDTAISLIASQAVKAQKTTSAAQEMARIKQEYKTIKSKLNNSVRAIEEGLYSKTIADNIQSYETQLGEIRRRIDELKLESITIDEAAVEYYLKSLLTSKKEHERYKLDMFQAFIHRVIVYPDKVEIQYNYTASGELKNPVSIVLTGEAKGSHNNLMVTQ